MKQKLVFGIAAMLILAVALSSCAAPASAPVAGEAAATHAAAEAPADAVGHAEPAPAEEGKAIPAPAAASGAADSAYSESAADGGSYGNYEDYPQSGIQPGPGVLTAGEWRDHENWDFFTSVLHTTEWQGYQSGWSLYPENRVAVTVGNGGKPVENALVTLYGGNNEVLWKGNTDNKGKAYLFYDIFGKNNERPSYVTAEKDGATADARIDNQQQGGANVSLDLDAKSPPKALDLMFVIDTTGSMSDELSYLTTELDNVVAQVKNANGNIPVRVSVNFYRDLDDEYVVKSNPFTENVADATAVMRQQSATGGGDYEEAVDMALEDAVIAHDWDANATKLMFLVLDAPPHNTREAGDTVKRAVVSAAKQGIRIVPVASSGVDKQTEYLLRSIAAATGGTYTFLTDHSGVGEEHIEPTIGDYEVQYLNDLLVAVIGSYLKEVPVAQ